jgi:hypothetical protein
MTKKLRSIRGQAIIEFALMLPLLLIIVLGIIEFGVLFYDKAVVTNASREGARAGMAFQTDSAGDYWSEADMRTKVRQTVNNYLQARLITFGPIGTINIDPRRSGSIHLDGIHYGEYAPGIIGTIDVVVTYQHTYLVLPSILGWGRTANISAETIMRLE